MKIVFHIGTFKTGTTSIQQFIMKNRELLSSKYGILYPLPDANKNKNKNQHIHISGWVQKNNTERMKDYFIKSKKEAMNKSCHTIVYSTEGFSSLSKPQVESLFEYFEEDEIEVIVYFRNVYKYILSTMSQLLKKPDDSFFTGKFLKQVRQRLDFDNIIDSWNHKNSKISINCYDIHSTDIVANFFSLLNMQEMDIDNTKAMKKNVSLGLTPMLFLVLQGGVQSMSEYHKKYKDFINHQGGQAFPATIFEMQLAKMYFNLLGIEYKHELLKPILWQLLEYSEENCADGLSNGSVENWNKLMSSMLVNHKKRKVSFMRKIIQRLFKS